MLKAVRKVIDSVFRASFVKRLTSINLMCTCFDFSITLWRLVFYCSCKFISNGRLIKFFWSFGERGNNIWVRGNTWVVRMVFNSKSTIVGSGR